MSLRNHVGTYEYWANQELKPATEEQVQRLCDLCGLEFKTDSGVYQQKTLWKAEDKQGREIFSFWFDSPLERYIAFLKAKGFL